MNIKKEKEAEEFQKAYEARLAADQEAERLKKEQEAEQLRKEEEARVAA